MTYYKYFLISFTLLINTLAFAQIKPNVVIILTDDQGWGDLSLHGNRVLETPQLDKLAKSGKEFTNFYVSPLCAPSRASILTGRYHLNTGVLSVSKGLEIMDTEETTIAELFKANGYHTGIFGKWHNGQQYPNRPNDQGFDEFLGFCAGHWSNYFNTQLEHNGKTVNTKGYITDVLTNAALKFMSANKDKPFLCYIPYNAPHSPFQVPDKYFNKYKAKGLDSELASVYGMVENVDDNVGRVLRFLKENNLEENTIVIFLSDNGPNTIRYNGMMRGIKGTVHEGGTRVPFFVSWKNHIQPGQTIETYAGHIDIYPTLRDLCNLKNIPGKPLAGVSLASLILKDTAAFDTHRNLYTHVNFMEVPAEKNSGGFRYDQFRFVFENNKSFLYDISKDPEEKNDLSSEKSDITTHYFNDYKTWFTNATAGFLYSRPVVLSTLGAELPAFEATLSAGIKFKEGHGWAHDWVETWNNTNDSIYWEIDCKNPGNYVVEIDYLCKKSDVGSHIICSIGSENKEAVIKNAFYSKQIRSPDRVPRKEAYEMSGWKRLVIGTYHITSGKQVIKLRASQIQNDNVAEINLLRLMPGKNSFIKKP
ncbi:MAG: arylsulfatase [Chitinophagaceae bacterium]